MLEVGGIDEEWEDDNKYSRKMKETGAINDSFLVSGRYEWSKNVGIFYVVLYIDPCAAGHLGRHLVGHGGPGRYSNALGEQNRMWLEGWGWWLLARSGSLSAGNSSRDRSFSSFDGNEWMACAQFTDFIVFLEFLHKHGFGGCIYAFGHSYSKWDSYNALAINVCTPWA